MRFSEVLASLALAACVPQALAYPGMAWKNTLAELQKRTAVPADDANDSNEMLGDLVSPGPITPMGKLAAGLLVGNIDARSNEMNQKPAGPLGSSACAKDTCCVWTYVAQEMWQAFRTPSGRCNKYARGAVRLAFHDAGPWKKGLTWGGADGSILLSNEMTRNENKGLEEIAVLTNTWYNKYKQYGVTMADLIQMGGTVATVVCPLGPRIRSFVGRPDSTAAAQPGLMPEATHSADYLIKLFEDKTIKPHGLASLVGAHTTSQQRFFDQSRSLDPQDSTPGVWDVLFYPQTINPNSPKRVLKFPSDVALANHPRIKDQWAEFAAPADGQEEWNDYFAKEMIRMSFLGVFNINNLVECTKVLPPEIKAPYKPYDQPNVDLWANGGFLQKGQQFGQMLADGKPADNQTLMNNGIDINSWTQGFGKQPAPWVGHSWINPAPITVKPIVGGIINKVSNVLTGVLNWWKPSMVRRHVAEFFKDFAQR